LEYCAFFLRLNKGIFYSGITPKSGSLKPEQVAGSGRNTRQFRSGMGGRFSPDFPEVREAAHLRWQIENNVFKRLSYLSGTKRFTFKDNKPFLTMLLLFFSAITMFDAYIYMLQQNKAVFKQVLGGMKFTWTNLFSQLEEQMENRFFCILFGSE
jgi:hypothetical protein